MQQLSRTQQYFKTRDPSRHYKTIIVTSLNKQHSSFDWAREDWNNELQRSGISSGFLSLAVDIACEVFNFLRIAELKMCRTKSVVHPAAGSLGKRHFRLEISVFFHFGFRPGESKGLRFKSGFIFENFSKTLRQRLNKPWSRFIFHTEIRSLFSEHFQTISVMPF